MLSGQGKEKLAFVFIELTLDIFLSRKKKKTPRISFNFHKDNKNASKPVETGTDLLRRWTCFFLVCSFESSISCNFKK